jgi:7-cyano-7-deazaguanine synthase
VVNAATANYSVAMTIAADFDDAWATRPVAVLASGVDSAVLVALLAERSLSVTPLYVRCGLAWEATEEAGLRKFLAALAADARWRAIQPLEVFHSSAREAYGAHWSITGDQVPSETSADAAVFLPGRNLMLLLPASLWAYRRGIDTIALGSLRGNPFADAQRLFFDRWETIFEQSVGRRVRVVQPLAQLSKRDVLALGRGLPLDLLSTCLAPIDGRACGHCNKCAELAAARR